MADTDRAVRAVRSDTRQILRGERIGAEHVRPVAAQAAGDAGDGRRRTPRGAVRGADPPSADADLSDFDGNHSDAETSFASEVVDDCGREHAVHLVGELGDSVPSHSSLLLSCGLSIRMIGDFEWDFNDLRNIIKSINNKFLRMRHPASEK